MTIVINFYILLTQHFVNSIAYHYSKTMRYIKFRFPVFILGSRGITFEKKIVSAILFFKIAASQYEKLLCALSLDCFY